VCIRCVAGGADVAALLRSWRKFRPAVLAAVDGIVRGRVRRGMALQRASWSAGQLQVVALIVAWSVVEERNVAAVVAAAQGDWRWIWFGDFYLFGRRSTSNGG